MAKLVLLRTCSDVYEALCIKAALDAADLFCLIPDQHISATNWGGGATIGKVRVLVMDADINAAKSMLNEQNLPQSDAVAPCPQCGSVKTTRRSNILLSFLSALMTIPAAARTKNNLCHDCKHRWKKR